MTIANVISHEITYEIFIQVCAVEKKNKTQLNQFKFNGLLEVRDMGCSPMDSCKVSDLNFSS